MLGSLHSLCLPLYEVQLMVSLVYRGTRRTWEESQDLQDDTACGQQSQRPRIQLVGSGTLSSFSSSLEA